MQNMKSSLKRTLEDHVKHYYRQRPGHFIMPNETADLPPVQPVLDHGRWLVMCPFCNGAEMLDEDDLRFFCLSCYNQAAAGMWLTVALPQDKETIEKLYAVRTVREQIWRPGMDLTQVEAENVANGLDNTA